jgi:hypothetical protein
LSISAHAISSESFHVSFMGGRWLRSGEDVKSGELEVGRMWAGGPHPAGMRNLARGEGELELELKLEPMPVNSNDCWDRVRVPPCGLSTSTNSEVGDGEWRTGAFPCWSSRGATWGHVASTRNQSFQFGGEPVTVDALP